MTKPPYKLRHALPDPSLANIDSSPSNCSFTPYSSASTLARQLNPLADDAIPEAVGKLFLDSMVKSA